VAAPGAEQQDVDPDDSPEAPWPHTPGERVVVHFATGGLPARYADLVGQAATIWARSPCVEPVVVDACPAESNCSTVGARVRGADDDTDGESDSDDRGGVRRSNTITLYTGLLDEASDNGALATIVHEMGHALGLVHRLDRDSVMNAYTDDSTDPVPDEIDFANLAVIYG
jgi:Zn-dependent protease with chaperone function